MDGTTLLLLFAVLIIGGILLAVVMFGRGGAKQLDSVKYQTAWLAIELKLKKDHPDTYMITIMEADKLLDQALRERGFAGQTMGDRMKAASKQWTRANAVWGAHKLRNRYAHEANTNASYKEVAIALAAFRRGLRDLGAF